MGGSPPTANGAGSFSDADQKSSAGRSRSSVDPEGLGLMKTIVHVNQHIIRRNQKTGERQPVLTVKTYCSNQYAKRVKISGPCEVVYSPDCPLACGARVWIETRKIK